MTSPQPTEPRHGDPHPQTINLVIHLAPETAALLRGMNSTILAAIEGLDAKMTKAMDDYKAQWTAFTTKLDAWIAAAIANQTNSDALVAAAVKKEQDGQDVDMAALSAALTAEAAKVPDAPTTPPAPPAG